jgi:predicted peptidase
VVFLHGLGERGEDGMRPTEVGIGPALRRHPSRFPCLVLFPQCPGDRKWTEALGLAEAALAATLADYPVDRKRIALTGISMGGFGAWAWAARRPHLFARLMPLCAGGDPMWTIRMTTLPIWAFHGARDPVVSVVRSRELKAALEKAGGSMRYTEFPEATHNCWDRAYGEAETAAWLLGG